MLDRSTLPVIVTLHTILEKPNADERRVMEARAQSQGRPIAEIEAEAFSHTAIAEYVTPGQIADQVLYLASARGRTISGQAISICGGTERLG